MRILDNAIGYDYISTHVDDFKVVAKDPSICINQIVSAFVVKEYKSRKYTLSIYYTYHDRQDRWTYGFETYAKKIYL